MTGLFHMILDSLSAVVAVYVVRLRSYQCLKPSIGFLITVVLEDIKQVRISGELLDYPLAMQVILPSPNKTCRNSLTGPGEAGNRR
jgi:hypothetical protein